jgi:C-terminal processing protease CtpA/Prc
MAQADATPAGKPLRLRFETQNAAGDTVEKLVRLDLSEGASGTDRLRAAGLEVDNSAGDVMVANVGLGSQAAKYGLLPGDTILAVATPRQRMSELWFMVPALLVIGLVAALQRSRATRTSAIRASA